MFKRAELLVSLCVSLNGENLEEVRCFNYLGVDIAENGTMEGEVCHGMGEEAKVL